MVSLERPLNRPNKTYTFPVCVRVSKAANQRRYTYYPPPPTDTQTHTNTKVNVSPSKERDKSGRAIELLQRDKHIPSHESTSPLLRTLHWHDGVLLVLIVNKHSVIHTSPSKLGMFLTSPLRSLTPAQGRGLVFTVFSEFVWSGWPQLTGCNDTLGWMTWVACW